MVDSLPVKRRSPASDSSVLSTQKKLSAKLSVGRPHTHQSAGRPGPYQTKETRCLCTADSFLNLDLERIKRRQEQILSWDNGVGRGECPDKVIGWCELPEVEGRGNTGVWIVAYSGSLACFNVERLVLQIVVW